ncbi:MAG: GTPase [Candidatus Diapherotrites archaeon]
MKMRLSYVPRADDIIGVAFRKANKEGGQVKKIKDRDKRKKTIEANKIKIAEKYLGAELKKIVKETPSIEELHPFYRELMASAVSLDEYKKSLGQLQKIPKLLSRVRSESMRQIFSSRDSEKAFAARKKFFARAASLVESADKSLSLLRRVSIESKKFPKINFALPTIALAGFPNAGKTTILKRLTGSEPEIAPYPFTTKEVKLGHFEFRYQKIQVIDTPGLLDRPQKNLVEKKALSALKHLAQLVVFIFDPTKSCGFTVEEQFKLLEELKGELGGIPFITVVNKADMANEGEIGEVSAKISEFILSGEGTSEKELKEKICENLKERKLIE